MNRLNVDFKPGIQRSTRVAFTEALMEMAGENPDILLVSSDSLKVFRADAFAAAYPARIVEVGISEQNAVGVAAGLASAGSMPFVATYAGFLTMRACEQMRTFVAYPGLNVKFFGANAGIYMGEREGVTHQFFEDLGILRTIPGFVVVSPADAGQLKHAMRAVAAVKGPCYIRVGSGRDPVIFSEDAPFELGKARILKEYGRDVALFSCGHMLGRTLQAAESLRALGVGAAVVEVHTLKPLDTAGIAEALGGCRAAVTVEDHNVIGGLGSAVCETAAQFCPRRVERVGLQDVYPESGPAEEVLDAYGMAVQDIVNAAVRAVSGEKERHGKQ
jgi:transketolase